MWLFVGKCVLAAVIGTVVGCALGLAFRKVAEKFGATN